MTGHDFVSALHGETPVFGTLITSTAPRFVEVAQKLALDFVFIDTEHQPIDRTLCSWMCQAYGMAGVAPIVRIPNPDPFRACMVLDGGAAGIIAPYVESAEQVRVLVGVVKYRPLKGHRLERTLAGEEILEPMLKDYLAARNRGSSLIVNIESCPALEALDDILTVPGLDAVLIGTHDLTCSMGIPEKYDHPMLHETISTIIDKARSRKIGAGVHTIYPGSLEHERALIARGANLIVHQSDLQLFTAGMTQVLDALRGRRRDRTSGLEQPAE